MVLILDSYLEIGAQVFSEIYNFFLYKDFFQIDSSHKSKINVQQKLFSFPACASNSELPSNIRMMLVNMFALYLYEASKTRNKKGIELPALCECVTCCCYSYSYQSYSLPSLPMFQVRSRTRENIYFLSGQNFLNGKAVAIILFDRRVLILLIMLILCFASLKKTLYRTGKGRKKYL